MSRNYRCFQQSATIWNVLAKTEFEGVQTRLYSFTTRKLYTLIGLCVFSSKGRKNVPETLLNTIELTKKCALNRMQTLCMRRHTCSIPKREISLEKNKYISYKYAA